MIEGVGEHMLSFFVSITLKTVDINFMKRNDNMNIIVAVDNNWGIGYKNDLLVRIPNDQRFFREKTTGNVVIMGRKTLESFPEGKPLKNRTNIVITSDKSYKVDGAIVVHSIEEVLRKIKNIPIENVFVIGGSSIYRQMISLCDTIYVTKISRTFEADTYFPNLDEMDEWKITSESEEMIYNGMIYKFSKYKLSS